MTTSDDEETVVVEVRRESSMAGRVPARLRARLGDDATFGVIELLDAEKKGWGDDVLTSAADRFERRLTEEVSALRAEVYQAFTRD